VHNELTLCEVGFLLFMLQSVPKIFFYKLILMRGEVVVPGENKVPETDGNRLKLIPHAIAKEKGLNASVTRQSVQLLIFPTDHPPIP